MDILDAREQEVIKGRFGLEHGGEERTQREIAKELGISFLARMYLGLKSVRS